jgi:lysophospholipase L1-like esterase
MKRLVLLACLLVGGLTAHAQGYAKTADREAVPFEKVKGSVVLFTFGQSNSANFGQRSRLYTCQHEVYNYFNDTIYKAKDPLLGANGGWGSVWTLVGDKMIEKGLAKSVTVIPIGVGGVEVAAWAKGGKLHDLLLKTLDEVVRHNIEIDYICWHQGESDNIANTPKEVYIERFLSIREAIRSRGIKAPIIVAVASYHPDCLEEDLGCSKEIREAQKELAKRYDDIFVGPDTDKLDQLYQRADGVHFSHMGQRMHADMWIKAIKHCK